MSRQLAELAAARGMTVLADLLSEFPVPQIFERELPDDPRLHLVPGVRSDEMITLMVRRGADPRLIAPLLARLEGRPLERGLVAWDALKRSILPPGDPLLAELKRAARAIAEILPDIDLNRWPADAIIRRFSGLEARAQDHETAILERTLEQDLSALGELVRRGDVITRRVGLLDSLRAYAGSLHLARLPLLASVYLDWITRRGHRPAALDLCEVLFDAGAPQCIPGDAIQQGDLPAQELAEAAEYLTYRTWISLGELRHAHDLFRENEAKRPKTAPARSPRLVMVAAHLGALAGEKDIALSRVDRICEKDRLWRYGNQVRVIATAAQSPPDSPEPLNRLHEVVSAFGNDLRMWSEALTVGHPESAWRKESARLLGREARALPHEPALWKVMLMFLGDQPTIQRGVDQIDGLIKAQCEL
jgi:hypothetical protein